MGWFKGAPLGSLLICARVRRGQGHEDRPCGVSRRLVVVAAGRRHRDDRRSACSSASRVRVPMHSSGANRAESCTQAAHRECKCRVLYPLLCRYEDGERVWCCWPCAGQWIGGGRRPQVRRPDDASDRRKAKVSNGGSSVSTDGTRPENADLRSPRGRSHRHTRIIRVHELATKRCTRQSCVSGTGLSASRLRHRSFPWYCLLMTTRAVSCTLRVVVPS